ncbi:hypothetical protein PPYR_12739 [Photinus pyralis]|uniref:SAM domain-containing protein n=2 Tax=Photinus pyralis TaxID=7054 RepID=A0A5N4A767_PHOPY|nr:uncharacterized protein LOC116178901 [Photinus pyralis]KAB0793119.1 hypothetical protein PPYR_12739 [Photinus pyralis]
MESELQCVSVSGDPTDIDGLLKCWGLEILSGVFKEHQIDLDSLQILDQESIRELIPQIGLRLKLWNKLEAFRKPLIVLKGIENADVCASGSSYSSSPSPTSSFNSLSDVSVDSSFDLGQIEDQIVEEVVVSAGTTSNPKPSCSFEQFEPSAKKVCLVDSITDLQEVLENSPKGKYVLAFYKKNGVLNRETRQKLVDVIIEHELKADLTKSIPTARLDSLAVVVQRMFPTENKDCYFAIVNEQGKKSGRGKLFTKYYNLRRRFTSIGLINKKAKSTATVPDSNKEIGEENSEIIKWLENNVSPWTSVINHWTETFHTRRNLLTEIDICTYLKKFPALLNVDGFELLENDFSRLHPGTELKLYSELESVTRALVEHLKDTKDKKIRSYLDELKNQENSDKRSRTLFCILPYVIPTTTIRTKQGQWRPSRLEVKESFVLHVTDIGKLQHVVEARQDRLSKWKETLQPFIVIVGTEIEDPLDIYVRVETQLYKVCSFLKAVDICFKVFFALNARYPIECNQVWLFIQYMFYEIECPSDKKSVGLSTLINDLRNLRAKLKLKPT